MRRTFTVGMLIGLIISACWCRDAIARYQLLYAPYQSRSSVYGSRTMVHELNQLLLHYGGKLNIGVYVQSMRDGRILYRSQDQQRLIPASTAKILTASAALLYLGPKYRFMTKLVTNAKAIHRHVLQGDVYLSLGGDPTLNYDDLKQLFFSLKRIKRIHSVAGNIYIDGTAYDNHVYGPGWGAEDKKYCYGAPIHASIINRNCIAFSIMPTKQGHYARVVHLPGYFYPAISNTVLTTRYRKTCLMHLSTNTYNITRITGCMPSGNYSVDVEYVIRHAPRYTQALVKHMLATLGIRVKGRVMFRALPRAKHALFRLGTHLSDPLQQLVHIMLKRSDNVIAAALFKKLGQLYVGAPGSWAKGQTAVLSILSDNAHIVPSGIRLLDGSGLSHYNRISARQMGQLLNFIYHHYPLNFELVSALPIAGVDGTLKHRLTHLSGRVRAKTGTLAGVVGLAGYMLNKYNEPIAFTIMINSAGNSAVRDKALEDAIVNVVAHDE